MSDASRPRAATGPGSLLLAELGRLGHRRLIVALVAVGTLALLLALTAVFFTHDRDLAGARAKAQVEFEHAAVGQVDSAKQCRADPGIPATEKDRACPPEQIDPSMTADAFLRDPRLRADQGLPAISIGIAVAGGLLMSLIGATAVGADWSSRAIVTLLTWQPRRLRFLATRLGAVAIFAATVGVLAQLLGLGLGALTVATRGTFESTPTPSEGTFGGGPVIGAAHFWRDLLLLQGRGVLLMVLVAVVAAGIATITRSTGGFLGVALGWFVVVEVAGRGLLAGRYPGLAQWTLTQSVAALVTPGGVDTFGGGFGSRTIHLSNLDGFWHLALLAAVVSVLAAGLLRRRDL